MDTGSLVGRAVRLVGIYTEKLEIFVGANVRINGCKALLKFTYSCFLHMAVPPQSIMQVRWRSASSGKRIQRVQ